MDIGDHFLIRDGVAYPEDPEAHEERIEEHAFRMLQNQVRDATWRLHEPTRPGVEALTRLRLTSLQSACARALTHMSDFAFFDMMAGEIRAEVEEEQEEQGIQMPPPLGPEWDPENDPAMAEDQEMQAALELEEEEEPEDDSEEEDPEMVEEDLDLEEGIPEEFGDLWDFEPLEGPELDMDWPEEEQVVLEHLEGAPDDGELTSDSDSVPEYTPTSPSFYSWSPIVWTPPSPE